MDNREEFNYTYSPARQQEVENIRKKYLPKEEDKMDRLRKLHQSASRKAQAWAIAAGIIGALLLGTGTSLIMTELGMLVGEYAMVIGIAVGIFGLFLVTLAYPMYNHVLKKERRRIAPEILRLTDELMK